MKKLSYLYWYVLQTTQEVVAIQAVQIIAVVSLENTIKDFNSWPKALLLTDFRRFPSALNEMMSILSGTWDLVDLVDEMVEAVEPEDLLEVETISENWSHSRWELSRNFARL